MLTHQPLPQLASLVALGAYRKQPAGDTVAARLISKAGSLQSLAKAPASNRRHMTGDHAAAAAAEFETPVEATTMRAFPSSKLTYQQRVSTPRYKVKVSWPTLIFSLLSLWAFGIAGASEFQVDGMNELFQKLASHNCLECQLGGELMQQGDTVFAAVGEYQCSAGSCSDR